MQSNAAEPANVIHLRNVLHERFPQAFSTLGHAEQQTLRSEVSHSLTRTAPCLQGFDWHPGTLHEVIASPGFTGVGLLSCTLLEPELESTVSTVPMALIDGANSFVPNELSALALANLLWVRCQEPKQAIRAADLLLRDGNIPRVLLDLYLSPAKLVQQIPSTAWHRLRMLAENSGTQVCVFSAFKTVSCARSRLILEQAPSLEQLDLPRSVLLQRLKGEVQHRSLAKAASQQNQPLAKSS